MKNIFYFCCVLALISCSDTKSTMESEIEKTVLKSVDCGSTAHFRGIQAVTDKLVWLSGTQGTVLKTEDGGKSWDDVTVPECTELDFRDIHALDKNSAWVMSSGNGVRIYHTSNGGQSWTLQFEDKNSNVFMDGMDFYDSQRGIVYGDPIDEIMDVLVTTDGGKNWKRSVKESLPYAWEDEAAFAASGTGVVHKGQNIWMATGGGEISRIIKSSDGGITWQAVLTPLDGGPGIGIFSMAFKNDLNGVVVGGNYIDSTSVKDNCAFTVDGGNSWTKVEGTGPRGYRSCVTINRKGTAIACGRTGIDKSDDFQNWTAVSDEGFFTADAGNKYIWLAGRRGKVAVLTKY